MPLPTIGSEINIAAQSGPQTLPAVGATPDGHFSVGWCQVAQSYYLARFNADGTADGGSYVIPVDASSSIEDRIELVGMGTNQLAVAFVDKAGGNSDVYLRVYWNDYGGSSPHEIRLTNEGGTAGQPLLFTSPDGTVSVGYTENGVTQIASYEPILWSASSSHSAYAENHVQAEGAANDDGERIVVYRDATSGAVRISSGAGSSAMVGAGMHPHIAHLAEGGFAVAWDGPAGSVQLRLYEEDGQTARTGIVNVDTASASQSHVCALRDGRVLVVWRDLVEDGALATSSVQARLYNADGTANTDTFTIDTLTSSGPATGAPRAVELADGRIVVTYQDGPISSSDINAKILDPRLEGVAIAGTAFDDDYVGSAFADTVVTGNGHDKVAGGGGIDTVHAGLGNDTISGGAGNDVLIGEGGDDVLLGDEGNDQLTGAAGMDTLNGGVGSDTMTGGAGSDTYIVDSAADTVVESGIGVDTVYSSVTETLSANVEKLVLTGILNIAGTGNELDNTLTGNSGNNTLDGLGGDDIMIGGAGNDIYVVAAAGDVVVEAAGQGIDKVKSSITEMLAANVENLVLTGTANVDGTGNALANIITGNAGDNVINGLADNDTMVGGAGNDTYIVDAAGDAVVEAAGHGTDTVNSSVSETLSANVENLVLTGIANVDAIGNGLDNKLTGNGGNNKLVGGMGRDLMTGGTGSDTFDFNVISETGTTGGTRDQILDFMPGSDTVDLATIDANALLAGNQAFAFIGAAAFGGIAGQLRSITSATQTIIQGDVNGDSAADFHIQINGVFTLNAGDFVL